MWERFTESARRVIFFAQEEAGRLNSAYVSTEHILLGILHGDNTVAARLLSLMAVNGSDLRAALEAQITRDEPRSVKEWRLTPHAKRVVDLAYQEAKQMGNAYIGTEHLLLGLAREEQGLAGQQLRKVGVHPAAVRHHIKTLQQSGHTDKPGTVTPSAPRGSLQQAAVAINTFAFGMDTGNWPISVREFADAADVDFSVVNGIKARLTRAELQGMLEKWLGVPGLRVHTMLGQLVTSPLDDSVFLAYFTIHYFKGEIGSAAKFAIYGWYSFQMSGDYITSLTVNVSAQEGNPALLG